MFRKTLLKGTIALVLLLGILSFSLVPRPHAAVAAPAPVTYGDVQAIFHANVQNQVVFIHAHKVVLGAPVEDFARAAITPVSGESAANYCVDDWHIIRVSFFNFVDNVFFFTREQAKAYLLALGIIFTLDGVSVPVMRTPIIEDSVALTRFFGNPTAFSFQAGSFLAPTALSVGVHTAGLFLTDPVFGDFQDSVTFTVDPSGTGACLQG